MGEDGPCRVSVFGAGGINEILEEPFDWDGLARAEGAPALFQVAVGAEMGMVGAAEAADAFPKVET